MLTTDMKHAPSRSHCHPAYDANLYCQARDVSPSEFSWHRFHGGVTEIGYPIDLTNCLDFCFDNETPRHKAYHQSLRNRKPHRHGWCVPGVVSGDAYLHYEFWLSDGWEAVKKHSGCAPLYWERDATDSTGCADFHLSLPPGWHPLSALLDTFPYATLSFFGEADAFSTLERLPPSY